MPPDPWSRGREPVGQPRRHVGQGAAPAVARARWRHDRRRDGPGLQAARLRGGRSSSRAGPACSLARSRSPATRCARRSPTRGSSCTRVCTRPRCGARAPTGRSCSRSGRRHRGRGRPAPRRGRPPAEDRRHRPRDRGASVRQVHRGRRPPPRGRCARASGSTRSVTATGARCSRTWASTRRALAGDVILGKDVVDVADHDMVPRVTFTDPQVCAVGLTEAQAREKGINIRTVSVGTGDVPARTRPETGSRARRSS